MRITMLWIFTLFQGIAVCQSSDLNLQELSFDQLQHVIDYSESKDSLLIAYSLLAKKLINIDNGASIELYETALDYIAHYDGKLNKDSIYNYTKLISAIPLINGTRYSDANTVLEHQHHYYDSIGNQNQVAHSLILKGFLLTEILNFEEAAENFLAAEKIYESIDHVGGMNDANNRMGIIYTALQDHEKAAEYYLKVVKRCEERNSRFLLRAATNNLAESYTLLGDTIKAKMWSLRIIEIRKITEDNMNRSYLYKNLSDYALLSNDDDKAIAYLDSSLYYAQLVNVPSQIIQKKHLLSRQYLRTGQLNKQKEVLMSAVDDLEKFNFSVYNSELYEDLAQYYKQAGEYENATKYFDKFINARDSLDRLSDERDLKRKEESAKIQKYNQQILTIESDRTLKALQLKEQQQKTKFFWLFAILAAGVLIYLLTNIQEKKRSQDKLARQNKEIENSLKDKEILLKEIHHRVKNNLQVVSSMLNLNLRYVEDASAKEILLESRNRVKSMALIHQKLYQEEHLKGVKLKTYIESLVNNLRHSYKKGDSSIQVTYDIEDMVLDVDTLIPFGLIVNELISNSLKHAFVDNRNGRIDIKVHEADNVLNLLVKDNGVGIVENTRVSPNNSFGMTLIEYLAEKLKAKILFTNHNGTTVEIDIHQYSIYK